MSLPPWDTGEILAHNTDTSGNGTAPVIWHGYSPGDDVDPNEWHVASGDEYQAYLDYWNGPCPSGHHERGDWCKCTESYIDDMS